MDPHARVVTRPALPAHGHLDRIGDDRLGRNPRFPPQHRPAIRPGDRHLDFHRHIVRTVSSLSAHSYLDSGSRYNLALDTWTGTPAGPTARAGHTAVWTGAVMVVWGGYNGVSYLATGSRYSPGG